MFRLTTETRAIRSPSSARLPSSKSSEKSVKRTTKKLLPPKGQDDEWESF